jgi:hypothetical protein
MALTKMPKCAKIELRAKLMYTNGHFAYAYTAVILTDEFGLVRNVMLFKWQKDSVILKPIPEDFRYNHDLSHYEYFTADAGFDSAENYRYLMVFNRGLLIKAGNQPQSSKYQGLARTPFRFRWHSLVP